VLLEMVLCDTPDIIQGCILMNSANGERIWKIKITEYEMRKKKLKIIISFHELIVQLHSLHIGDTFRKEFTEESILNSRSKPKLSTTRHVRFN
jgi:hypothetical protein